MFVKKETGNEDRFWGFIPTLIKVFIVVMLLIVAPTRFCEADQLQMSATALNSSGAIFWHFDDLDFVYTDGNKPYFKVLDHGSKLLWSPTDQMLKQWDASDGTRLQKIDISMHGGGVPLKLDKHTSLIWHDDIFISNSNIPQTTSFEGYYEIINGGDNLGSFYIVANMGNDHIVNCFSSSDGDRTPIDTLKQKFDTNIGLWGIKLPTGLFILAISAPNSSNVVSSYVIGLRTVPTSPLSFGGNVFLIPASLLAPALKAAGVDLRARYTVVENIIASATPVPLSRPDN